jgi:hypothetical protein
LLISNKLLIASDQSIYSFRSAQRENLDKMRVQYAQTEAIFLEHNYRSSGAILHAASELMTQDTSRLPRKLLPTHCVGTKPTMRFLEGSDDEASWIVSEIKRTIARTGHLIKCSDIAVLVRSASITRPIEAALSAAGIPYEMVGGHRFFDRVEIKLLIDYLRAISFPDNDEAILRVLNVPPRRIGDPTIKSLVEEANKTSKSLWSLVLNGVQGNIKLQTKIVKGCEQGLGKFVDVILTGQKRLKVLSGDSQFLDSLVQFLLKKIDYRDYLSKQYKEDVDSRWENVEELIAQCAGVNLGALTDDDEDSLPQVVGIEQQKPPESESLVRFLANVSLSSGRQAQGDTAESDQLTISTMHAAKGLEWPVVFIPAAYDGSIPHSRAEDSDEERRLLYVAMTRAKALLYISQPAANSQKGKCSYISIADTVDSCTLSPFLAPPSLLRCLERHGPKLHGNEVEDIARILGREFPTEEDIIIACQNLPSEEDDLFPWTDEKGTVHYGGSFLNASALPGLKRKHTAEIDGKSPVKKGSLVQAIEQPRGFVAARSQVAQSSIQPGFKPFRSSVQTGFKRQKFQTPFLSSSRQNVATYAEKASIPSQSGIYGLSGSAIIGTGTLDAHFKGISKHVIPNANKIVADGAVERDYGFLSSPPEAAKPTTEQREVIQPRSERSTLEKVESNLVNLLNPSRKTLGVKRSMNGWASRGFSLHRHA